MREPSAIGIRVVEERSVWQLKTWQAPQAQTLPVRVGETCAAFGGLALGIGPQEWLVVGNAHELHFGREPAPRDWVTVDLTDAFTVLSIQGESARELLSKGCGLDLHPCSFGVGRCARTRFAQIPLVLVCVDDPGRFELYVARSYARYLHAWLVDARMDVVA